MMGTGAFAVPTLRALYDSRHQVAALVTQPLRPKHGRRAATENPLRHVAEEHRTPILDPADVSTSEAHARLARCRPQLLVVADYGQILSDTTLSLAPHGAINLHASLLPKYRGAAPVNWALYHGETETGVTVFHIRPKVDSGPCLAQTRLAIDPDETAVELEARLAELGAPAVCWVIDELETGRAEAQEQDPARSSRAPRLKKADGAIDWTRPATAIRNHVRAMEPWPKTFSFWHRERGEPLRLILGPVNVVPRTVDVPPGTVLEATAGRLVVAAGQDALLAEQIQPSGKRMLAADEFLRGYPARVGELFGPEG